MQRMVAIGKVKTVECNGSWMMSNFAFVTDARKGLHSHGICCY